jgi:hypothetical protein
MKGSFNMRSDNRNLARDLETANADKIDDIVLFARQAELPDNWYQQQVNSEKIDRRRRFLRKAADKRNRRK